MGSLVGQLPLTRRKYAEFGTMCIRVPVKKHDVIVLCEMYKVSFRAIYEVNVINWCLER